MKQADAIPASISNSSRTTARPKALLLSFVAIGLGLVPHRVMAQMITPDTTLPINSGVNLNGNIYEITAGTPNGPNLFHSFSQFSVPDGFTAHFQNDRGIANIFARVTGDSLSTIDGSLQANGTANLFLLNPNGIIFGATAQLQIGGSVVVSTADLIRFQDGVTFLANGTQTAPLLTLSMPIGLQYGANPSSIRVTGPGHNLGVNPDPFEILRDQRPVGLQVSAGQTLALVGGAVEVAGGNLTAASGRVEVGAVANGTVTLGPTATGWALSYPQAATFRDVLLTQAASVDVSGSGGTIQIQGQQVGVRDGSSLLTLTLGNGQSGNLTINAAELGVAGVAIDPISGDSLFPSSLLTEVNLGATGRGGDLNINTGHFVVAAGAKVSVSTSGSGQGGHLTVNAGAIDLIGGDLQLGASLLSADVVGAGTRGAGGNVTIQTGQLTIREGAGISVATNGIGDAGRLKIGASTIELLSGSANYGASGIFTGANGGSSGNGGDVAITTQRLQVTDGAQLLLSSAAAGPTGNLTITAQDVNVTGTAPDNSPSGIFVQTIGNGAAGNLTLQADRLQVSNGGQIGVSTFSAGNAGNLNITAQTLTLMGAATPLPTGLFAAVGENATGNSGNLQLNVPQVQLANGAGIFATTQGAGNAGNLVINSDRLDLTSGAVIAVNATSSGNGGNLAITANQVTLEGEANASVSRIAALTNASGTGGNVTIAANLQITDGARIFLNNYGSGKTGDLTLQGPQVTVAGTALDGSPSGLFVQVMPTATGNAGTLNLTADRLQVSNGGQIGTSTFGSGNAGTLKIGAPDIVLIGSDTERPTGLFAAVNPTATGNGGNLGLATQRLSVSNGAQIAADTLGVGNAGNLTITAQDINLQGFTRGSSGLFVGAIAGTGAGGDLKITTDTITIRDGATINASNFSSRDPTIPPGQGAAGNIQLTAHTIRLDNGLITASTAAGSRGNINLQSRWLSLRQGSTIATNAQGSAAGGNITLNTDFLIAQGNSDITANAVNAQGGRVIVNAQGLFGIQARDRLTPDNDITASSALGAEFNGTVEINLPPLDPTQGLTKVPTLVDQDRQIQTSCDRTQTNKFLLTGRGGLPPDAAQPLTSNNVWTDLRLGEQSSYRATPIVAPNRPALLPLSQLVEANSWFRDVSGNLVLVAAGASGHFSPSSTCRGQ